MIHVETRQAVHPDHARAMDTAALRRHFLAEGIFAPGEIRLVYTHYDRFVVGAAVPDGAALVLDRIAEARGLSKAGLLAESDVSGLDISVETANGTVSLSGDVDSQAQIDRATAVAREIEGVRAVDAKQLRVNPNR